ncbi:MAG: hypothetical protein MPN21_07075 [Thermoanaerobaculia bacterium]|nr:hypothetical protein [Thermoanaerobaculia bacterium]
MKLSVYVPKELEEPLRARADAEGMSPALYVQSVLRGDIEGHRREWSDEFRALAGSWKDDRSTEEIVRDIEESRISTQRAALI